MNRLPRILLLAGLGLVMIAAAHAGDRASFNDGWRFHLGEASGAESPEFVDDSWRSLRLPHDWAIEGQFDYANDPQTGGLPVSGVGWYRKTFKLPAGDRGRHVVIEFDGAMAHSEVWLNGERVGGRPNGYVGFEIELDQRAHYGDSPADPPNVIAVRLAPEDHASRWYPGAGLYRNVWLFESAPVHVAHWGTVVRASVPAPAAHAPEATLTISSRIENGGGGARAVIVRHILRDAGGRSVARHEVTLQLPAGDSASGSAAAATATATAELAVPKPTLWDIDHPYLYTLDTEVVVNGVVVDRETTPVGIRSVVIDAARGFFLNGRHLKIHGVCLHHDLGALGAAVNRRALERQLEILRGAGVNAVRTSHNAPAPELLELADRMGFLVMDEAFDMWRTPKVPNGSAKYFDEWSERDLRDQVRRDRNHPSVILWSIGNEVPEQDSPEGRGIAHRLGAIVHEEDPTRPTTGGFDRPDDAIAFHLAEEVDAFGLNYKPNQYAAIHREHPAWPLFGSETASCISTRGAYHWPLVPYDKHPSREISSYDLNAPSWAYCADVEFAAQDAMPWLLGEFVWTGFDYLGEPIPYYMASAEESARDWPARSSYFGFVDLAGFPKDRYYLYQSVWTDKPMVHLLPHWTWPGHEGEKLPLMAYSNAERVELFLNGKSLGSKLKSERHWQMPVGENVSKSGSFDSRYRMLWQVPYQAGTLRAVAYKGKRIVAQEEVHTAGAPARLALSVDRSNLAGRDDLAFVTVRVEDRDGNLVPDASNEVKFALETGSSSGGSSSGSSNDIAAEIAGVDNGDSASIEPFHADHRKAFHGLALLIVRAPPGAKGSVRLSAASPGLAGAGLRLSVAPEPAGASPSH